MTREQIAEARARAGLPQPTFGPKYATLKIGIGPGLGRPANSKVLALGPLPNVTRQQFDRWCRDVGRAGTARWINQQLGTLYRSNDVYHMRRRDERLGSNIRRLVRDFPGGPVDPKPR